MIDIKNLSKSFGNKTVFKDADIFVEDAGICGLVGINGAGKSTLLRILSGILKPDGGCVLIDGENLYDNEKIKSRIFFLPDEPYFNSSFTGTKLKELYKTFYSFDDEIFSSYTKNFALDINKPIRNFSKGMKRQIFIAAALACKPRYLFLDEAFDGLDPLARLELKRGLITLKEDGSTVIIASHSLRELEDICDSFVLIDNTSVKVSGNIEKALDNIFKLQLAFDKPVTREELPFESINYELNGRVITVVAHGDKQIILKKLAAMKPILIEEIPIDFEDMFIEEVRGRGHLK